MLRHFISSLLTVAMLSLAGAGCQRATIPMQPDAYLAYIAKPHTVVLKGDASFRSDTTSILLGFRPVFSRQFKDRSTEITTDLEMPKTGHYQVRLHAGCTYQIAWMLGDCRVETEEFSIPNHLSDSIIVKRFYMFYPDSTAYGGCLSVWQPQYIPR